jgi:Superinfection immunity protein
MYKPNKKDLAIVATIVAVVGAAFALATHPNVIPTDVTAWLNDHAATMATWGIVLYLALVAYLVPVLVANARRHRQRMAILALNVLLDWSLIGWVGALIWSLTTDVEKPRSLQEGFGR